MTGFKFFDTFKNIKMNSNSDLILFIEVNQIKMPFSVWSFDLGGRVSECTAAGNGTEDHCVRAGDLTFVLNGLGVIRRERGT